jgi:hypothetical protein
MGLNSNVLATWYSPPAAILIGALMLAVTGLFLFRWDIHAASDSAAQKPIDGYAVYRLDRWTGSVQRCATSVSMPGRLPCEPVRFSN